VPLDFSEKKRLFDYFISDTFVIDAAGKRDRLFPVLLFIGGPELVGNFQPDNIIGKREWSD